MKSQVLRDVTWTDRAHVLVRPPVSAGAGPAQGAAAVAPTPTPASVVAAAVASSDRSASAATSARAQPVAGHAIVPAPGGASVRAVSDTPSSDAYAQAFAAGRAAERAAWQLCWDEEKARAVRTGFDEGHASGLQQAAKEAQARMKQALQAEQARWREQAERLQRCAGDLAAARAACLQDAQDDLVALAHGAVLRMLGQAAASPETIVQLVQALQRETGQQALAVHVHPRDCEHLTQPAAGPVSWQWVADEHVSAGAVVKTRRANLDARLQSQVAAFTQQLLQLRQAREGEQP